MDGLGQLAGRECIHTLGVSEERESQGNVDILQNNLFDDHK